MRSGRELIGKPIYSLDEGRLLGSVKDLFVDLDLNVVSGVFLGSEGIINRKILAILRENIAVFGSDAVLTTRSDIITDSSVNSSLETWLRLETLQGRSVNTPGGTKVGNIGDVLLDDNAKITGYWLSKVRVSGPIAKYRQVLNDAVVETGNKDGIMTIDLSEAELQSTRRLPQSKTQDQPAEKDAAQEPSAEENESQAGSANEEDS